MNQKEVDKILKSKKKYFFIAIGLILISIILFRIVGDDEKNHVTPQTVDYGELIANQNDEENNYIKTTITYISLFAVDEDYDLKYYYIQDASNRVMIARISDNTYEKIVETYQNNKEDFTYDLEGYIFNIPDEVKELAINGFSDVFGNQGIVLDEENYENYFGKTYLNEYVTPSTEFNGLMIGAGILLDCIAIVLIVLYVLSAVRTHKLSIDSKIDLVKLELLRDTTKVFKKQNMYLTEHYIVSVANGIIRVIGYDELVWVYDKMLNNNGLLFNFLIGITKDKKEIILSNSMNYIVLDEISREIQSKNKELMTGFTSENIKRYKEYKRSNF